MDKALKNRLYAEFMEQEKEFRRAVPSYDAMQSAYHRVMKHRRYGSRMVKLYIRRMQSTLDPESLESSLRLYSATMKRLLK